MCYLKRFYALKWYELVKEIDVLGFPLASDFSRWLRGGE